MGTDENLQAAFAGESQARNRYSFFASKAKKEGYEQIAAIYQETADNEKEHAEFCGPFNARMQCGIIDDRVVSFATSCLI